MALRPITLPAKTISREVIVGGVTINNFDNGTVSVLLVPIVDDVKKFTDSISIDITGAKSHVDSLVKYIEDEVELKKASL